jgi:hypothetical protein
VLAFETAGGVAHEILYDRMKQVVLESYADRVVFHPLFAALVKHYSFKAIPLALGYKEGKGKVENAFKYVYSDFLKGNTFHDLQDLNRKAEAWLRDIAWVRRHGTTQERPLDRMDEERPDLIRLPPRPFLAARIEDRLVGYDFCIAWETNRYSVSPSFVGRSIQVMALDGILDIALDGEVIARHQLRRRATGVTSLPSTRASSVSTAPAGTCFRSSYAWGILPRPSPTAWSKPMAALPATTSPRS